ncbi:hypothetical protein K431DRAFT_58092 [Polychaeton citri CBS 116435]|uniref:polynucleotide adenylyltransferase n=1 Tax=Polychaeton citri CBS 116435 TaxID=1314669 RepID=A0A9P4QAM0_9PEZI|nr:hypothetical protein K431DRAFT_58092 [Polychaeton citri CBS 116435]
MATPQHDQFARQYPPRPQIKSQHSSSVPTTPYQAPRDARFTSRSPSPHRGLSNHSPRSVASEAVGMKYSAPRGGGPGNGFAGAAGGAPTVCKFEFAPELPKRRIKYVDGGDQELGPPKKEPKKSLDPDEEYKLSGDLRELYDRLLPSKESEDRRTQLCKKLERILDEEWPGNDIQVNMFGSSGNLLSSSDSDVDLCITTDAKALGDMHELAKRLNKHGMEKVVCRAAAKVPIVKCWDPELQLACDVNVNNPLALENTRMIKTYVQLDDRVRPLAKIIKYWTKRRILNDAGPGGTISSYTWICMILNFLQRRDPPILPSLQKMRNAERSTANGQPSDFVDDVDALKGWGKKNNESLAQLLFQFFRHYGYEFEYTKHVVSVREGRLLSRTEKGWETNSIDNKEGRHRLCVEEPFNTYRNLGNSADEYSWSGLHNEIRRAFELLEDGCQIEKVCEQYEFPPEERHIFQRPPPKPKPTLTRSASQSGRSNNEGGSGRSRKGTRNQSQRGSRRASSGASFSNQRNNNFWLQSPPTPMSASDYFGAKGNLHDQLYQQYMALQMHQDALKTQLLQGQLSQQQVQQAQVQVRGQVGDMSGSPDQRQYINGVSSPRYLNNPPQSAPLLPGYIHHYTARYPPGSPMMQARQQREGTNTNPSSPSLAAAMPALRRDGHRNSVADGSSASSRSQSQPGRSVPNAFTMQQYAHPGYDVSGALNSMYPGVRSASGPYPVPGFGFAPMATLHAGQSVENAMPKEYVGYIHHQSPQFGPQPMLAQSSLPHLTLQNPPQRQRKGTYSDLVPPTVNGRHSSRSPSPLGHGRSHSTIAETGSSSARQSVVGDPSPTQLEQEQLPESIPHIPEPDHGGPIIVNGSGPAADPSALISQQQQPPTPPILNGSIDYIRPPNATSIEPNTWGTTLPLRASNHDQNIPPWSVEDGRRSSSPKKLSPGAKSHHKTGAPTPRLNFSSPNGGSTPQATNGTVEHVHHIDELSPAQGPLLSPVVELRTPSPTNQRVFDNLHYDQKETSSPKANGDLSRAAKVAAAKETEITSANHDDWETTMPTIVSTHDVSNKAHTTSDSDRATRDAVSPSQLHPYAHTQQQQQQSGKQQSNNPWQQATGGRKGHKKSKSTAKAVSSGNGPSSGTTNAGGQPEPANAAERKGG